MDEKADPKKIEDIEIEEDEPERETWNNKIDFLLACIGFSVGLGNVWRFPYLCYKNGGGAFLIPYLICVIIGGIPLFFLEVSLGQFMSSGGMRAWLICPLFMGIGFSTTMIVFFLNCYYNVILAWAFYYLFASFTSELPWDRCDNEWNTDRCSVKFLEDDKVFPNCTKVNSTWYDDSITYANGTWYKNDIPFANETWEADKIEFINDTWYSEGSIFGNCTTTAYQLFDSTTEYWENKVLGISEGIHDMGSIKWDICLCLLFAWIVVYLCICKGIKTSGKVMYVTATSPYIFMLILLIRGALLPGAIDGILFYVVPEWSKIANIQVWVDAGTQIFFSYSISLGALTALGSYNKFNHNSYRDSILFAVANSGTSIFAGFVIFTVLGYMAHVQGTTVDRVAESGPGLAFIAYPKAVAQMPIAPLWSFLFFLMIILLGLDSQFVGVEGLTTAFMDQFPKLRRKWYREGFIAILCVIMFFIGLAMVTNGGMYIFQLFDYYTGSRIILLVAFFMCVVIGYIYGINRYYENLEMMLGFRPNYYMYAGWVAMAPIFCITIFIMSAINYSELTYDRPKGTYKYPDWAVGIGWGLACLSAVWIPLVAIVQVILTLYRGHPISHVIKPQGLKRHQLRPQDMVDEVGSQDNPGFTQNF